MDKPTLVYVSYIATTLEQLWSALISESFTEQYWDGQLQSDWQVGSPVQRIHSNGEPETIGEVLQSEPPYLLSYTFQSSNGTDARPSRVRFRLEQYKDSVKLTLIHDRLDAQSCLMMNHTCKISLAYLKRLLELEAVLTLAA